MVIPSAWDSRPGPLHSSVLAAAALGHDTQSRRGLEGPDQHRPRVPLLARDHVDAVVDAVGDVDIEGSPRPEHRVVAGSPAVEGVGGGVVTPQIGLGLHDATARFAATDGGDEK